MGLKLLMQQISEYNFSIESCYNGLDACKIIDDMI